MTEHESKFSIDWRVAFGLAVTIVWITTGITYLLAIVGLDQFIHLPTADIGSFLEGAFAPLAFLWLVIGHFMQQKEITANTKAIKIQEQSARRLEIHSQRDSYFKLLNLVQDQLGAIASFHYISICGPTGTGEFTGEELAEQRSQAGTTDHAWFIRKMVGLAIVSRDDADKVHALFFGTAIRTRHSENFTRTFGKLLDAARAVDTEQMVEDALLHGSAAGMLYRIIQHVQGNERIDTLLGTVTAPAQGGPPA